MKFPLATVLRVRRIQKDVAQAKAAVAHAEVHRAVSEHARREAALAGRPEPGSARSAQWLATRAAALAMASDVVTARHVAAGRELEAAEARDRLGEASSAHKGIEGLAERHAEQVRRERDAAEQRASDDRVNATYRPRGGPGGGQGSPSTGVDA